MATPLLDTMDSFGPPIYYSQRFRQMVEDHLTLLQGMTNRVMLITSDEWSKLNRFEGDFYGFLTAVNIPRKYQWTVMRMNGFRSRFDLDLSLTQLVLPEYEYIDKLAQLSKEKRGTS